MLVKYFNNPELAYTTRKRYGTFSFEPFYQEEQRSVLLGDGANTQIKTSVNNICKYVMIGDTRWFVTSYIYMNGKQVTLNLQRDVIGEFGLKGCYGKIERGYTNSVLKNRKELNLNQILKERIPLLPEKFEYGNYFVNTHKDEMWGILYLVKPTGLDPITNEPYPEQVNINIPLFNPKTVDYEFIENGTKIDLGFISGCSISFNLGINYYDYIVGDKIQSIKSVGINFEYVNGSWTYNITIYDTANENLPRVVCVVNGSYSGNSLNYNKIAYSVCERIAKQVLFANETGIDDSFLLPSVPETQPDLKNYDNITIKKDNSYYHYKQTEEIRRVSGRTNFSSFMSKYIEFNGEFNVYDKLRVTKIVDTNSFYNSVTLNSYITVQTAVFNCKKLTPSEAGQLTLYANEQLVDEPYIVLAFPLFDVDISGTENYHIDKTNAFMVFNTVIQYLSGENPYLVDAQIYPYCPVLTGVSSSINGYPFFRINSTSYEHKCRIQLLPDSDVKKEYIEKEYSIVSPEQSAKFTFNFYDYVKTINDVDGKNYASIEVIIKTALKPFGIVSSAVISAEPDSLMGLKYSSDLRGSQPSGNGFECSLSSNAFEQYKRQNSNYQQIFALQKDELKEQHRVENINNTTGAIVNTATATAMGAIAGASLADAGIFNSFGAKSVGASIGAGLAGGLVGTAMGLQVTENQKLMQYEEYLQQQNFDLQIGTIKNLPNSINRISSFNEIILQSFYYVIEVYSCSEFEKEIVDDFIEKYAYGIGTFGYLSEYQRDGWFLRSTLITSSFDVNLHQIAEKEVMGGIYYYEQT